MSMVERVARALCENSLDGCDPDETMFKTPPDWVLEGLPTDESSEEYYVVIDGEHLFRWKRWRLYILAARAAIEVMREPTDAMREAGDAVVDSWTYGHTISTAELEEAYTVMIDAALRDA